MAEEKSKTGRQLGDTGETVRRNIRRIRDERGISGSELSRRLDDLGRPIPVLGIQRIEAGTRRVDVDDLMAIAEALGVSPISLLMPNTDNPTDSVPITGDDSTVAANVWAWLAAADTLNTEKQVSITGPQLRYGHFGQYAWPRWIREEEMLRQREELRKELRDIQGRAGGDD